MYPTIETLKSNPLMAILTGHTCGEACWHAIPGSACHCSCGGHNHAILTKGGKRPGRTRKIGGEFYDLVAVCATDLEARKTARLLQEERFPGLDQWGYGAQFRDAKHNPVNIQAASESQAKWEEVIAINEEFPRDCYLVWARPAGTRYILKASGFSNDYKTKRPALWSD